MKTQIGKDPGALIKIGRLTKQFHVMTPSERQIVLDDIKDQLEALKTRYAEGDLAYQALYAAVETIHMARLAIGDPGVCRQQLPCLDFAVQRLAEMLLESAPADPEPSSVAVVLPDWAEGTTAKQILTTRGG
jgi:hypothetical protein